MPPKVAKAAGWPRGQAYGLSCGRVTTPCGPAVKHVRQLGGIAVDAANGRPRVVGAAKAASKRTGTRTADDATRRARGLERPHGAAVTHNSGSALADPPPRMVAAAKEAWGRPRGEKGKGRGHREAAWAAAVDETLF